MKMNRNRIVIASVVLSIALFTSSCAFRTCPTYAKDVQPQPAETEQGAVQKSNI